MRWNPNPDAIGPVIRWSFSERTTTASTFNMNPYKGAERPIALASKRPQHHSRIKNQAKINYYIHLA